MDTTVIWALQQFSLGSAIAMGVLPLRSAVRAYFRTPFGVAFTLHALAWASFAGLSWALVTLPPPLQPPVETLLGAITLTAITWLLQYRWLVGDRSRRDVILAMPGVPAMVLALLYVSPNGVQASPAGPVWTPAEPFFSVWLVLLGLLFAFGIAALISAVKEMARVYPQVLPLLQGFIVLLTVVLAVGFLAATLPPLQGLPNLLAPYLLLPAMAFHLLLNPANAEGLEALRSRLVRIRCILKALVLLGPDGNPVLSARSPYVKESEVAALLAKGREMAEALTRSGQNGAFMALGENHVQAIRGRKHVLLCLLRGRPNDLLKLELLALVLVHEEGEDRGAFSTQVEKLLGSGPVVTPL